MRDENEHLLDILEAIERIEKYAGEGKNAFEADEAARTTPQDASNKIGVFRLRFISQLL